jgi:nucleotide-binding universal stress UspA family protein
MMRDRAPSLTLRKILCPIDLSEVSRAAFRRAAALAAGTHGVVHVIHAVDARSPLPPGHAQGAAAAPRAMREWLAVERVADVPIEHHLVRGPAATAIVAEARSLECDAIVMGTHGRTGVARAFLGSVAETVVRTSPLPTMVVRGERAGDRRGAPSPIRAIVCPVDFSAIAEHALTEAARLGRTLGAEVHAVHCWELARRSSQSTPARASRDFSEDLAALAARCAPPGIEVQRHLRHGAPDEEILALALAIGADLIVMATAGRTGLDHLLTPSVAERVVRTSPIPVLTLRAPAPPPS